MKRICVLLGVLVLSCAIAFAQIRVTSPNGGQAWRCGERHSITWTSSGCGDRVKIELVSGVATTVITERTGNEEGNNDWPWTIPEDTPPRTDYRVRITTVQGATCSDRSDANFSISCDVAATLTLSSPDGGEDWEFGRVQAITWSARGISGTVRLELLKGERTWTIKQNLPASPSSFSWEVGKSESGSGTGTGTGYIVRISTTDGRLSDQSNSPFTIGLPRASGIPTRSVSFPVLESDSGGLAKEMRADGSILIGGPGLALQVGERELGTPCVYRAFVSFDISAARSYIPSIAKFKYARLFLNKYRTILGAPFSELGDFQVIATEWASLSAMTGHEEEYFGKEGTILYSRAGHTSDLDVSGIDVTEWFKNLFQRGIRRFQVRVQFQVERNLDNGTDGLELKKGSDGCALKVHYIE